MRQVDGILLGVLLGFVLAFWSLAAVFADGPWGTVFDNVHWTLAYAGAAVLAWRGFRRAPAASPERRFRFWLVVALGSYGLGQVLWDIQVALDRNPFPAPSDLFFLSLGPLLLWGFYRARRTAGWNPGWTLPWTDTALLTLGVASPLLAVYLPLSGATGTLALVVLVLYPVLLLAALFAAFLVVLLEGRGHRRVQALFVVSLAGQTAVWMVWNYLTLVGGLGNGLPINLAFSVTALVQGWAGAAWSWSAQPSSSSRSWQAALPLAGLVAAVSGLVLALVQGRTGVTELLILGVVSVVAAALGFVRQGLLSHELMELARFKVRSTELEQTLGHLNRTQDQLIQSEKLAALGQLIAGIAHDLNSPLGAIRSAASQIRVGLDEQWPQVMASWEKLAPDARDWVRRSLAEAEVTERFSDSRQERAWRRDLAAQLAAEGRREPERLAQAALEAGLRDRPDAWAYVAALDDPYPVLEVLAVHRTIRQLVQVAIQASDRASGVVSALRHYLHSGPSGDPVHLDLAESVQQVLPLFHHRVRHGITLDTSLQPDLILWGWPEKLTQVWVNLLTNALQAVGFEGHVQVRAFARGNRAVVEIEDDGPGVPPELRERIFEPFFTTKAPGEGTGLGLDVSRRVVEALSGTLSFTSEPGRTIFRVDLPLALPS